MDEVDLLCEEIGIPFCWMYSSFLWKVFLKFWDRLFSFTSCHIYGLHILLILLMLSIGYTFNSSLNGCCIICSLQSFITFQILVLIQDLLAISFVGSYVIFVSFQIMDNSKLCWIIFLSVSCFLLSLVIWFLYFDARLSSFGNSVLILSSISDLIKNFKSLK